MFIVEMESALYQIDFDHVRGNDALFYLGHEGTYCEISDRLGITVSKGHTELCPSDNYDKNFGRKLSLARALKNGGFSTPERTLFWEAYFKARGKVN